MLDQVLGAFAVHADYDLDLMQPGQTLSQITGRMMSALEPVFAVARPDLTIVQGDTTTTLCGGLASFYQNVPVAHVEAGLRTGDIHQPFPEEMNRVLTGRIAALHFAPTRGAAENLEREGVRPETVFVTGNTGIDAVLSVRSRLDRQASGPPPFVRPGKKIVLITAHRRESFGPGFEGICEGIRRIALRNDVQVIYPVHRNPNVTGPVERLLAGSDNVTLIEPLDYVPFVDLMGRATLLLTDSGGVQEEGPSLGKPILVMRDKTERPEAVAAGTVRLVGTDPARIESEAGNLLEHPEERERMSRVHNPYGDGHACDRISHAIHSFLTAKSQSPHTVIRPN